MIVNSFFNTSDFSEEPITKYLEPYFVESSFNVSHYYNMNLAINQNYANDNYLWDRADKAFESVQTRIIYPYTQEVDVSEWQGYNNAILSFKIFMDNKVGVVERRTYKLVDALSAVGGLMSVVFIAGMIFVSYFQEFIYKQTILGTLFV